MESSYESTGLSKSHFLSWIVFKREKQNSTNYFPGYVTSNLCSESLRAFVDSDWANDTQDYISVTGFIIFFSTSPISWTAKKQKLVTLSSTEAEFVALCDVTREILWLQPLLEDFQTQNVRKNTIILEDDIPAINLAQNEQTKGITKHILIKASFVYQNIQFGNIHIEHIGSSNNLADCLSNKSFIIIKKTFYTANKLDCVFFRVFWNKGRCWEKICGRNFEQVRLYQWEDFGKRQQNYFSKLLNVFQ